MTPFFPSPQNWRGAYCLDFVNALIANGKYDIKVFTGGNGIDYEYQGIVVHTFKIRQLPSAIFPLLFAKWNQQSFIKALKKAEININHVAICHANTALYALYSLAVKQLNRRCLTLLHHHDLASFGLNLGILRHCWLYNIIQFPILRRMHEAIDCHLFVSEASRNSFLSAPDASWTIYNEYRKQMKGLNCYDSCKIKKSIILHNGIDTTIFYKTNKIKSCKNSFFTIGCIGNFCELKDQISLLKALIILQRKELKIKIRFIGSGPDLEKCKRFVNNNNLQTFVTFEKECIHSLLPEFYRNIDLFVLPSYFEGFGCVFVEAWACGTPFITCEGQGMDDLIPLSERKYWLVRPRSPEDLAEKILFYISNRSSIKQHLNGDIDINKIINEFLNKINKT